MGADAGARFPRPGISTAPNPVSHRDISIELTMGTLLSSLDKYGVASCHSHFSLILFACKWPIPPLPNQFAC